MFVLTKNQKRVNDVQVVNFLNLYLLGIESFGDAVNMVGVGFDDYELTKELYVSAWNYLNDSIKNEGDFYQIVSESL